jgi:hypothetical protein
MSINDYVDEVEGAARHVLGKAGAIEVCERHPEVTIRLGDERAERHAYALATTMMRSDGSTWMREDVLEAIKDQLDAAADGECPHCANLMVRGD